MPHPTDPKKPLNPTGPAVRIAKPAAGEPVLTMRLNKRIGIGSSLLDVIILSSLGRGGGGGFGGGSSGGGFGGGGFGGGFGGGGFSGGGSSGGW